MMTCVDVFDRASDFHDGDLAEGQSRSFAHHLETCTRCRDFYRSFEETVDLATRALVHPVPVDLEERILRGLRQRIASA
jgi:anti-sigma factor RsiW